MARGREDRGSPNNSDIRRRFMREFEEEIAGGGGGKKWKAFRSRWKSVLQISGEKEQLSMGIDYHYRVALDTMRWPVYSRIHFWLDTKRFDVSFLSLLSFAHSSSSRDNIPAITKRGEYNKLRNNDLSKTVRSLYPCKRVIV